MKHVLVLYTGGTIAMQVDAGGTAGLMPTPPDLILAIPELDQIARISARSLFQRDSADLGQEDWILLVRAIHDALSHGVDGAAVDGIVVAHGTDTMAYGASFVALLLGPLPVPVVFTGAQRPLTEVRSDARTNLIDAVIAATLPVPEVCIAFDSKVLRALRATKLDASGFEAFGSPSLEPLVRLGLDVEVSALCRTAMPLGTLDTRFERDVLFVRVFPGLDPMLVERALNLGVKGLVLSTYGTGALPSRGGSLLPVLQKAQDLQAPVLIVSQCIRGFVDLGRYESGVMARALGAISGRALTIEAALAKMMVALGRFSDRAAQRAYLEHDQLGEM
jgi:L-asparaginase